MDGCIPASLKDLCAAWRQCRQGGEGTKGPVPFCYIENGGKSPWDGGPLINLWYASSRAPPEGSSIFPMILLLLLLLLLELIERSWKLQSLKVLQDGLEEEDSRFIPFGGSYFKRIGVGLCRFLRLHAGGGEGCCPGCRWRNQVV